MLLTMSSHLRSADVDCGNTADWIWIPFGVVSGVGLGMGVLNFVVIVEGQGAAWGEFAASHCNQ